MRFKIDWASLIVEGKFTVFALFYFVFEGNFPNTNPRGLIYGADLTEGFLRYRFGGAYIWRGLFSEFYGIHMLPPTFLDLTFSRRNTFSSFERVPTKTKNRVSFWALRFKEKSSLVLGATF